MNERLKKVKWYTKEKLTKQRETNNSDNWIKTKQQDWRKYMKNES
jgi:hypothetical protein